MKQKNKPQPKVDIPAWLWFPIYLFEGTKWNEEKQRLSENIIRSIKNKAEFECLDSKTIDRLLWYNKHDDSRGYMMKPTEEIVSPQLVSPPPLL